jgi:plastocyanin
MYDTQSRKDNMNRYNPLSVGRLLMLCALVMPFAPSPSLGQYAEQARPYGVPEMKPRTAAGVNSAVTVRLSEWKIDLSTMSVPPGTVTFTAVNTGAIPHAFEVEGKGIEKETTIIQPNATASLTLALGPGTYQLYCPVGEDSHRKLGMATTLTVAAGPAAMADPGQGLKRDAVVPKAIEVTSGGPVIQILPGPFPFPDSAAPILQAFGPEREGLESQVKNGPYSNNVAPISGSFRFAAWDRGATSDSVNGVAEFTTQDHVHWKLVLDRVQTKDVPHHPRFGGVILGLYYHGNTGVHTPLVPTINSAVALWAVGDLYRDGALITHNAMAHVMLLSHTRRDGDFTLSCWDCSRNTVDELQLQVLPGPGEPQFDAPGGFLFVNWEQSKYRTP